MLKLIIKNKSQLDQNSSRKAVKGCSGCELMDFLMHFVTIIFSREFFACIKILNVSVYYFYFTNGYATTSLTEIFLNLHITYSNHRCTLDNMQVSQFYWISRYKNNPLNKFLRYQSIIQSYALQVTSTNLKQVKPQGKKVSQENRRVSQCFQSKSYLQIRSKIFHEQFQANFLASNSV